MRGFGRDERGQAIVIIGLVMVVLLAGAGLAVDAGLMFVERRREQVAADAAAYAGAVEIAKNWTAADRAARAQSAALAYAALNGYDNDGTTNTVTTRVPPAAGAYAGNTAYVEVTITVAFRTAFIRFLSAALDTQSVSARAVAGVVGPSTPYSIIALSKTASPAFEVNGNVEVRAEEAGVLVNSSGRPALLGVGNARIRVAPLGVDVVGTTSIGVGVTIDGPVVTGASQVQDPLAYLQPPVITTPTNGAVSVNSGTTTLAPGIYDSITVGGNGEVVLVSGVYVIRGGGISVTGGGRLRDEVPGDTDGPFIYNACSNYPASGGTCGAIRTSGNGRFEIDKPATGAFAGVSIWQPCENISTMSITGASSGQSSHKFEVAGSVYLPCAGAEIFGGGANKGLVRIRDGQLVASTVRLTGQAQLWVDWDSAAGTGTRLPAVVE